ncbi:sulfatase-like hydrolase/transferase [Mycoplasmatota bacterium]|nr:sulfatase-like hydrolase/transferase [Mycoplasmatota bacterium]
MEIKKRELVIKLYLVIFIILSFLEIIFRLSIMGSIEIENFFRIFLFVNAYTLILIFLVRLLPRKVARYFTMVVLLGIIMFYFSQDLYYRTLSGFFSFSLIGDANAGFAFIGKVFKNITWIHILYLLPIAIVLKYFIKYKSKIIPKSFIFYVSAKDFVFTILLSVTVFSLAVFTIPHTNTLVQDSPFAYSPFDLYIENPIAYKTIENFGVLTYLQRDIITSFNEIDDEETIESLIDTYMDTRVDHEDNAYTGYFEDKNLILIMAESFDTYAIDPTLTPNIYQMQQNSWNFTQYYSPLYYRNTADTEFMAQTGLYAHKNVNLTMDSFSENEFPNTMPRLFEEQGYGSYSFHNYLRLFLSKISISPRNIRI